MLKIRLTRRGKKSKAFFRLVVAEHTAPIKGRFIEALGFLNPHTKEKNLKSDRIKYWLEKGAQCSDTTHNLLVKEGIIKGPKRTIKIKKKKETADDSKRSEEKEKEEKIGEGEKEEMKTRVSNEQLEETSEKPAEKVAKEEKSEDK